MYSFPASATSDLIRNNIETQFSFFSTVSATMLNATLQLGALNAQASRKLMEESTATLVKGMQLRTLADAQTFIAEQSRTTIEKMRGYQQNVQNIAAETRIDLDPGRVAAAPATEQSAQPDNAHDAAAGKDAAAPGQHEGSHHPSALVEKLIDAVVGDPDKLRKR